MRRVLMGLAVVLAATAFAEDKPGRRPSDEVRGKELFTRHCQACHGSDARGEGPMASSLNAAVPDLKGRIDVGRREELAQIILRGAGAMPSFDPSFDKTEAISILKYLETELGVGGRRSTPVAVEVEKDTDVGGDAPADP